MTEILTFDTRLKRLAKVIVESTQGIGLHMAGLKDADTKECLLRTVTALMSLGYRIPGKKIVITIEPQAYANTSMLDLPVALALISEISGKTIPDDVAVAGELGLDGSVRPLPAGTGALCADIARNHIKGCLLPTENALEAIAYTSIPVCGCDSIQSALLALDNRQGHLIWKSKEFKDIASRAL